MPRMRRSVTTTSTSSASRPRERLLGRGRRVHLEAAPRRAGCAAARTSRDRRRRRARGPSCRASCGSQMRKRAAAPRRALARRSSRRAPRRCRGRPRGRGPVPSPTALVVKNGSKTSGRLLRRDAHALVRAPRCSAHGPSAPRRRAGPRARCRAPPRRCVTPRSRSLAWIAFTTRFVSACWTCAASTAALTGPAGSSQSQRDAALRRERLEQRGRLARERAEVDAALLGRAPAREVEQLADDARHALRLLDDDARALGPLPRRSRSRRSRSSSRAPPPR